MHVCAHMQRHTWEAVDEALEDFGRCDGVREQRVTWVRCRQCPLYLGYQIAINLKLLRTAATARYPTLLHHT
jgi:hypothetical protein